MNRDHLSVYLRAGTAKEAREVLSLPLEDQLVMTYLLREEWRYKPFPFDRWPFRQNKKEKQP